MATKKGTGLQTSPSSTKKKASARATATGKAAGRAKVPVSTKQASQSRYPGETPLTGEDRPANRPGGKRAGQRTAGQRPGR